MLKIDDSKLWRLMNIGKSIADVFHLMSEESITDDTEQETCLAKNIIPITGGLSFFHGKKSFSRCYMIVAEDSKLFVAILSTFWLASSRVRLCWLFLRKKCLHSEVLIVTVRNGQAC